MGRIKIREVKKNDHEARIQQEIQERTTKGTNLRDLVGCVRVERRLPEDAGVRTGFGDEGEEGGPGPPGS